MTWKLRRFIGLGCLGLAATVSLAGCTTTKNTVTPRSATEQLLLSTAADQALHDIGLEMFAGQKVFVDATEFDSYDSKYVVGTVRDALSRAGALLETSASDSDIIVEARSGALAINEMDTMFGIPAITLPMPLTGPVQTPEIAFYKAEKLRAYAKFAILVRNGNTEAHVYSSGPLDGRSWDKHYRAIFISWTRTNVPELASTPRRARQSQIWFPQSNLTNMPPPKASSK